MKSERRCGAARWYSSASVSAEALEAALDGYVGTVIAVSHDRWFLRTFDQFLTFASSGEVFETASLDMDQLVGG